MHDEILQRHPSLPFCEQSAFYFFRVILELSIMTFNLSWLYNIDQLKSLFIFFLEF